MFSNKLKKTGNKKKNHNPNEKKIENLVFFIVIVIITIIIINFILKDDKEKNTTEENNNKNKQLASSVESNVKEENISNEQNLKYKLEEILKKIQGVKDVDVFINYSESSETIAMYNENSKTSQTEESDTSGGTRKIEENDTQREVIYQEDNGEKIPITQKIVSPKIEGAIITAKGSENANVKTNIIQAVEAATGLPTHKIQVFEMN